MGPLALRIIKLPKFLVPMMAHPAWQVGFLVGELSNQGIACKGLGPEEPWQQGASGVRGSRLVGKLWLGNLNEWEVTGGERERER